MLVAVKAGDGAALSTLLERYQPHVYRFGLKMCRDVEDARDVLQETLWAMARTIQGFRGGASFTTWLYTIARSHCIKKRRRRKGASDPVALEDSPDATRNLVAAGRDPSERLLGKELEQALDEAIGALDPRYREVLLLRDVEGLTATEVAEVLGIGVSAVKSRLHRARVEVRGRLEPLVGREPAAAAPAGCPDVLALLSKKIEGEIGPEVCAEMERHLASCGRCGELCDSMRRVLRTCRSLPTPELPAELEASIRLDLQELLARRP